MRQRTTLRLWIAAGAWIALVVLALAGPAQAMPRDSAAWATQATRARPTADLYTSVGERSYHLYLWSYWPPCASGFMCAYVPDPNNSDYYYRFDFTKCAYHNVYNWYGKASDRTGYEDEQRGSYEIQFYTYHWITAPKSTYPNNVWHAYTWDPVNIIKPC